MQAELPASLNSWIDLLQKCRRSRNVQQARRLEASLRSHELHSHPILGNYLVPTLVECGSLHDAHNVFNSLSPPHRELCSWNSLISGYTRCDQPQYALHLYHQMQQTVPFVQPDTVTYLALLNACAKLEDAERARQAHAEIVQRGLERELFAGSAVFGNTLVDMYGKCGALLEARQVFGGLPVKDVFSWGSLIAGYAEFSLCDEARTCYERMLVEGISPDSVTYACSLKACGTARDPGRGRELHAETTKRGLERELYVGSALVDMYSKFDLLAEACKVFCVLSIRSAVSWNSLIAGFIEHGTVDKVADCYKKMREEGIAPNSITFVYNLKACGAIQAVEMGLGLHAEVSKTGIQNEVLVSGMLVHMYVECGMLMEGQHVFGSLPVKTASSWNVLISAYTTSGLFVEARKSFLDMLAVGVSPDSITFVRVLKACGTTQALEAGQATHAEITKRGLERQLHVSSALVDMYMDCHFLAEAHHVFNKQTVQDVVSWNTLISGYTNHRLGEEAMTCFRQMLHESVAPVVATFICSLKACGSIQGLETCQEIHSEVTKRGFEGELYVGSTLMDAYIECSLLAEARQVFDRLPNRSAVSWNTLIEVYIDYGFPEEGGNLFQQMLLESVPCDDAMLVCRLKACCKLRAFEAGKKFHAEIAKRGLESEPCVGNMLVDMYFKCGVLAEACNVFDGLLVRDALAWAALTAGYSVQGLVEEAASSFRQMQVDGISPDSVMLNCSLRACGTMQAVELGQEIHAEATKMGLEREMYVNSMLVGMYAQCCLFAEACLIFDGLSMRNLVSWNTLLVGYNHHCGGLDREFCNFIGKMLREGVAPDSVTFTCGLKACDTLGAIETGRVLHSETVKRGLEKELLLSSALLDMYSLCGAHEEACQVFVKLPVHCTMSWNSLIAGYAHNGLDEEVGHCIRQMCLENISLDCMTLVCGLKASGAIQASEGGRELHAETIKRGLDKELHVGSTLVDMYARCSVLEACQVFFGLALKNTISWNTLIAGYTNYGLNEEALNCFKQMLFECIPPDSVTFICLLKACSGGQALEVGQELHCQATKVGFEQELHVGSTLVDMYTECSSLAEGLHVFEALVVRDAVAWNALITGYTDLGWGEVARNFFYLMLVEGISPGAVTFVCCLRACDTVETIEMGQELHTETVIRGLEREPQVDNMLVIMYLRCGSLSEAHDLCDGLPIRNAISWVALISRYIEYGFDEEAGNCLQQMQVECISLDSVSFVCSLKACGTMGALQTAQGLHGEVIKRGVDRNVYIGSTLVAMYGKLCLLEEASHVFVDNLTTESVELWNALMKAYGKNHEAYMAVQCFEDMLQHGVKPNCISFVCLLAACSYSSFILKGQVYFRLMQEVFEIKPMPDHLACMVDLYARSGHVYEAVRFLAAMESPPSCIVLYNMLSACRIYGKVEVGQCCFQQLVELNQEDSSACTLMAEIYADAGQLSDAYSVEAFRKSSGAKKEPGCATIEINNKLQEFVVGFNQTQDILETLGTMHSNLKREGYIPNLGLVSRCTLIEDFSSLCGG